MKILAEWWQSPWFYLIGLLLIFGIIALLIFLMRKFVIKKNAKDEKPSDEVIAEENLSRFLEDVDDPETLKQFDEFKDDTNKEENK